jgi:hypothetical protein
MRLRDIVYLMQCEIEFWDKTQAHRHEVDTWARIAKELISGPMRHLQVVEG